MEEVLFGGGTTVVVRVGETVRRPARRWTPNVARLLESLRAEGVDGVPRWLGLDDQGRETLDYLPGEVGHDPLSEKVRSEQALLTAAQWLRAFHDATPPLLVALTDGWQFDSLDPVEVICHGDFAPYNCVFADDGAVTGVIDFDCARPGPRSWDLAYAIYRFGPLTSAWIADDFDDPSLQGGRAARFLAGYGCSAEAAREALAMVPLRLRALVAFMHEAAAGGDRRFAEHLQRGDADLYLKDARYAETNMARWLEQAAGSSVPAEATEEVRDLGGRCGPP